MKKILPIILLLLISGCVSENTEETKKIGQLGEKEVETKKVDEKEETKLVNENLSKGSVCFRKTLCLEVEVASTPKERGIGLMNREKLDADKGMLFVFAEENSNGFWMKNTLISLDMIWINKEFEVSYFFEKVQPCKEDPCQVYSPEKSGLLVLETNQGFVEENKIRLGEKAEIEIN